MKNLREDWVVEYDALKLDDAYASACLIFVHGYVKQVIMTLVLRELNVTSSQG